MSKKYLVTQDQTVDGMPLEGDSVIHYTTCSTAAATVAKTAALSGFKLVTGAWAAVKFTVTNTAANPTLNINSTGAKAIRYRNAAVSAGALAADRIYIMVYDGTYWQIVGDLDTNTTYTHPSASGNKHIPSGGSANQILVFSADGTAKWSSTCNAAAMDVVTGTFTATSAATAAYKSGRSKALIEAWVHKSFASTSYTSYGSVLVTNMSSSMTAISATNLFSGIHGTAKYSVSSAGIITLSGGDTDTHKYKITWFN